MQPAADARIARRRSAAPELLKDLGDRFQERCGTGQFVRQQHGRDESPYNTTPPDCVVFPTTSAEVAEVVRMCARYRVPVITTERALASTALACTRSRCSARSSEMPPSI